MVALVVALVAAGLAALLHVYIFVMESVLWTTPRVRATFGVTDDAQAEHTRSMAFNQGFYNLFLAVVTLVGTVLVIAGGTRVDGSPAGVWGGIRRSLVVGLTAIGLVVLVYLPHYLAVGPAIKGSLDGYLAEEGGENRASLLTLVMPLPVANVLAVVVCLGVAAWAVLGRRGREDDPALPALYLFGALLLTTTPVLAWYSLPLVALAVMVGRPEWLALAVAGCCAYGGHGAYPATPVAYAAALLVIYLVTVRRIRRRRPAAATPPPPAPRTT